MTKLLPVSPENCANKSWLPLSGYGFAAGTQFASIVAAELAKAVHALPLVFVQQANSFQLVALLSLGPGENLFVDSKGLWQGAYIPACFRGHPFRLAKAPDGSNNILLCVDEDSGLVTGGNRTPFFDAEGKLTKPTQQIFEFLQSVWQNMHPTQQAVTALANAGLLAPWPLRVKVGQKEIAVQGLLRIDEGKLYSMEEQAFLQLRKTLALPMAYAQLFSMANVQILVRLAQIRAEQKPQAPAEVDLNKLFGQEDLISFGDS